MTDTSNADAADAIRAAALILDAHAFHRLPEIVPCQMDGQATALTRENFQEVLSQLPADAEVAMSPFSLVPDNEEIVRMESGLLLVEIEGTFSIPDEIAALRSGAEKINAIDERTYEYSHRLMDSTPLPFHGFAVGISQRGSGHLLHRGLLIAVLDRPLVPSESRKLQNLVSKCFGASGYSERFLQGDQYFVDVSLIARAADWFDLDYAKGTWRSGGVEGCTPVKPEEIRATAELLLLAGCDINLFNRLGRRADRVGGQEQIKWLVEGVIPMATISLLAGAQGTGKSTLATELAVAVACGIGTRQWLGRQVVAENASGVVAILSGEDGAGLVNARLEALDPDDQATRLLPYAMDARPLPELCEALAKVAKLSLVIVDPARRYLVGDEDGSDSANSFFVTLEALAAKTGCAVLVLHHLVKNACPPTLQAVREAVRGSGVWLDRPRVMLGMFRRREVTVIGVAKHNIPPAFPMMGEEAFTRDPMTLRHIPAVRTEAAREDTEADGLERQVLAAINRLRAEGNTKAIIS